MAKLKKIAYQIETGEIIYVHERVIKGITKTAYITKQFIQDGKLVIEYKSKKGSAHGSMEIYDLGPDEDKTNIKEEI